MPPPVEAIPLSVAVIGNPNTGKSTLFNALAGVRQRVGNYPGVTVEKKIGQFEHEGRRFELIDLPGLYSLAARSRDEMVSVDVLLGRQPGSAPVDAVVCIVDAGNLQRNLYLVSQVLELGLPTVLALNMLDVAQKQGVSIDIGRLGQRLGVPVAGMQANRGIGMADLKAALVEAVERAAPAGVSPFPQETQARYDWIRRVLDGVLERPAEYRPTFTDRIDRLLTHRLWGTLLFVLVMVLVFQAVFSWARPFKAWIETGFGALEAWVKAGMAEGALRSLLADGVIGGVGAVIAFLPQILILFLFIAVLEDCGYLARASYLMDRLMTRVGLSGKSFIPMLASCACAVPGIMAARVIENERDRLTTILVAPLMTCSARLPIYAVLIGAFIPAEAYLGPLSLQGLTLLGLYALGIVCAVAAALIFRRTLLRGRPAPFVMELPGYKWPSLRTLLFRVAERGGVFLRTAGTIILAVSIIVWAALYYPHNRDLAEAQPEIQRLQSQLATLGPEDPRQDTIAGQLDRELAGAYQRQSILARAGRLVEPIFRPLGWDWRISCAVMASFPAREVVVATLDIVFNLGDGPDTGSEEGFDEVRSRRLKNATWEGSGRKVFNVPVALSIMVFFALCAQCAATLAVIRRETNSWRWPLFTFGYMSALAYLGALVTYQLGTWIGG